jgi:hypothetical protein
MLGFDRDLAALFICRAWGGRADMDRHNGWGQPDRCLQSYRCVVGVLARSRRSRSFLIRPAQFPGSFGCRADRGHYSMS